MKEMNMNCRALADSMERVMEQQRVNGIFSVLRSDYFGRELHFGFFLPGGENEPLLTFIKSRGVSLWEINTERRQGFAGECVKLFLIEGKMVLVYIERDWSVSRTTPLDQIVPVIKFRLGGKIVDSSKRTLDQMIVLKLQAAKLLETEPRWSQEEQQLINAQRAEKARLEALEREAEKKRKAEERETRRRERMEKIHARPEVFVFSSTGVRLSGIPVVEEEWMLLEDNVRVVLVESFDQETGSPRDFVEAFYVGQGKSPYKRGVIAPLFLKNPKDGEDEVEIKALLKANIDGVEEQVFLLDNEAFRLLKKRGINGGIVVATGSPDAQGRYFLYRFVGGEAKELTHYHCEVVEV